MPLPKLSPLQSRLAASLVATIMLLLLYLAFSSPHFAYASDVDSIQPEDHNHERLQEWPLLDFDFDELEMNEGGYEAEFIGIDRSIIGRATADPKALINNQMEPKEIQQGETVSYMFTNSSLWSNKSPPTPGLPSQITLQGRDLGRREDAREEDVFLLEESKLETRQISFAGQRTLYITVTACSQPDAVSDTTTIPPPQLQLFISQSPNNTKPGPTQNSNLQDVVELENGYILHEVNATGDVFIGVHAKNNTAYQGVYKAEVAMSIDKPYHYFWNSTDPNLFVVDSDDGSVLLFTDPFTTNSTDNALIEKWMDTKPPFVMFASDVDDRSIMGLQNSFCGLQNRAQISTSRPEQTTREVITGMTMIGKGEGRLPKQQFFINGLAAGKRYNAILAMDGNSTSSGRGVVGGGGQVFRMTSFSTLSGGNCAVIFGLSFCDQTAYSVPSNPNTFPNMSALAAFYDNTTQANYENFKKVIAQTPCETTSSAQFSLARTCRDCEEAYKAWLCSVSIPRCTDFNSDLPWLQRRAMGQPFPNGSFLDLPTRIVANSSLPLNGSRNPTIDEVVRPGPYKEVLPCDDICYTLVQSCPASIGFNCPQPRDLGFNVSYAEKPISGADANGRITNITCNYPGMAYYLAAGNRASIIPSFWMGMLGLLAAAVVLL